MPYTPFTPATAKAAPVTTIGAAVLNNGMTFLEMQTELGDQTGDRDDLTTTRNKRFINWAYQNLAGMVQLKELYGSVTINTDADQPFYLLPKQISFIKRASYINTDLLDEGSELAMIDEAAYRNLPATDESEPHSYLRVGRMLVIYPTPDDDWNVTLDVKIRPDDLVADTDCTLLPPEFDEAHLLMARSRLFRSVRQYKEAAQAQNDALGILRPLLNTDAEELDGAEFSLAPARKWSQLRGTKGIGR